MLELKELGPEQKDQLRSHRGKAMKGDNWGCSVGKGRQNAQEWKLTGSGARSGREKGARREDQAFSLSSREIHGAIC